MKKSLLLAGMVVFALSASAVTITDNYSTAQAKITSTTGSPLNTTSAPITGSTRAITIGFIDNTELDPTAEVSGRVFNEFSFSEDSKTTGWARVEYLLPGAIDTTLDLGYRFSLDWTFGDVNPGGDLRFFIKTTGDGYVYSNVISLANNSAIPPVVPLATTLNFVGPLDTAHTLSFGYEITNLPTARDLSFDNFGAQPVPEPGTYALMGAGLAALAYFRRRK